jgi:hypothetical protein
MGYREARELKTFLAFETTFRGTVAKALPLGSMGNVVAS